MRSSSFLHDLQTDQVFRRSFAGLNWESRNDASHAFLTWTMAAQQEADVVQVLRLGTDRLDRNQVLNGWTTEMSPPHPFDE
ncbi:MAG TPA: hypothetical protein VI136_06710 [Verrucomicrobiae bacterium]